MEMLTLNDYVYLFVYFSKKLEKSGGRANCILLKIFYAKIVALGGFVGKRQDEYDWKKLGIDDSTGLPYSCMQCFLPKIKFVELAEWFFNLKLPPVC